MPLTASATALMCAGVVPQQPPTMFSQPFSAQPLTSFGGHLGRLVVGAEFVGQAGIGIDADHAVDLRVERVHVGMQLRRAEASS